MEKGQKEKLTGIYQRLDESYFVERFTECNRESQFSRAGRRALFEYLENYSEDIGGIVEMDVIALCCEYTEYKNIAEFNQDYGTEYESMDDIEEAQVIKIGGESFIIQQF